MHKNFPSVKSSNLFEFVNNSKDALSLRSKCIQNGLSPYSFTTGDYNLLT